MDIEDEDIEDILLNNIIDHVSYVDFIGNSFEDAFTNITFSPSGIFPDFVRKNIYEMNYSIASEHLHKNTTLSIYGVAICGNKKITSNIPINSISSNRIIDTLIDVIKENFIFERFQGEAILRMLRNFLIEGVWHFGYRTHCGNVVSKTIQLHNLLIDKELLNDKKLTPIVYFGLTGAAPIECWTIDLHRIMFEYSNSSNFPTFEQLKKFWFIPDGNFDYATLFCNDSQEVLDYWHTWMFAEFGLNEPEEEMEYVRESCPIKLDDNDIAEIFYEKVINFLQEHTEL